MPPRNDAHPAVELNAMLALQRDVTEHLLLSALRESEAAEEASASRQRATFLADAGGLLAASLDESATQWAIAGLSLPSVADWCVVDLIDDDRRMHRLSIIHRDPIKQQLIDRIEGIWLPHRGDAYGIPSVLEDKEPVLITRDVDRILEETTDPEVTGVLRELRIGSVLSVPLAVNGRVFGAITFFGNDDNHGFTEHDVQLAKGLATRSAVALEKARVYAETLRLKDKAERDANATTSFLRTISHELRTPLQAIAGYVEIMVRGIHGPVTNDQRLDLERIIGSQRHVLILINELIEYIRADGARGALEPTTVLVEGAVRSAFEVIEPLMRAKDIQCVVDSSGGELYVMADQSKLHQILINLLANAVKFTNRNGGINVYFSALDTRMISIAIADTGRGIPAEKYDLVFEPFTQLQASDKDQKGGLGLGLSISRDLARAMNGDITVKSTVGRGSVFTITLPAAQ